MRLLITRPLPDALETARRLKAMGHEALVQPLLRIVFAPAPRDLDDPQALLVTSQNALRALESWPQAARWMDTPIYAVGKATARAAEAAGFTDVRTGGGDAAALAEAVREDLAPEGGLLIYPAARQRTGGLSEALTDAGYEVATVESYRAEAVTQFDAAAKKALAEETLDGVLLYSRRTAETFRAAAKSAGLEEQLSSLKFYVLSEQIGAALDGLDAEVVWPERPDEAMLLALVGKKR
jgi:uroporphyrinogen-III synthase